jgi:hypothetical protein
MGKAFNNHFSYRSQDKKKRGITMFIEITEERIIAISKKLNVYDESLSVEDLKDLALNTIEEVARDKDWDWKKKNREILEFYADYCMDTF